ncbi:MAG: DUF624 domain-containing protein [Eubacteriales bacterium]|nr:DUF624 domain-containing protein [Eubacteriales bacterium]
MYNGIEKKSKNEKAYEPRKETPAARMLYVVTNHFFRLLWANILCVLFSIPVVTAPAAMSGLHAVIQQYYRYGYGEVWPTFIEEFKSDFMQKLFSAMLPLVICAAVFVFGSKINMVLVFYLLAAASFALGLSVYGWLFPQLPLLDIQATDGLKNALILSFLETPRSLGLIAVQAVVITLIMWFYPVSLVLVFIIVPLIPALLTEMIAFPVIEKRLVNKEGTDRQ